jgi:hypothetical protein
MRWVRALSQIVLPTCCATPVIVLWGPACDSGQLAHYKCRLQLHNTLAAGVGTWTVTARLCRDCGWVGAGATNVEVVDTEIQDTYSWAMGHTHGRVDATGRQSYSLAETNRL